MNLRKTLLKAGNKIEEILERQIGMQHSDDMKLGYRFTVAGGRRLKSFFERHSIGARSVFLPSKRAQATSCYANIGGIQMAVDVEVRPVAVHPLTDGIRHPSDSQD